MATTSISADFVREKCVQIKNDHELQIQELKEEQIDVIVNVLQTRDTMAVLPTGFGKSVCFHMLPLLKNKVRRITD